MKKLLVVSLMLGLLTACGEKVPTTSRGYKKETLEKVYKKYDEKAKKEYRAIKAELEKLADNGSEKAEKELEKWKKIELDYQAERMMEMSPETEELARKLREEYGKEFNEKYK